jgi:hypothetical protein
MTEICDNNPQERKILWDRCKKMKKGRPWGRPCGTDDRSSTVIGTGIAK